MGRNKRSEKKTVASNLFWRFAERTGAQIVAFIVSVVLARLLDPGVYGRVALITVFTTILQVFVDSGLGNALIQKKDADDVDFSTVFYTNVVFCISLYLVVFFAAPYIAAFYNDIPLTPCIRVLAITILISGVKNVQQAYVSRHMLFRIFFFSTLAGTITAGMVGVAMALCGFGIWALVAQQIINLSIDTLVLWITVKWRPIRSFNFERLKSLWNFGWKLLVSSLLDTGYNDLRSLIIGKVYTSEDLAFYNQGQKFPNLIIRNINVSINSVLLPAMSNVQDDVKHLKNMTRRSITVSVYLMAPLMMGLVCVGEPLVRLILTEKWLPCVPFMSIFCITNIFFPIHTANLNAIKAMGRSDLFLILEILKKIVGIAAILITMNISVMAMAYSLLVVSVLSQIINSWPNRKLLGYSYLEQLKDIAPSVLLSCFMGVCVKMVQFLHFPDIITLLLQVIIGGIIYLGLSILLHFEPFLYVLDILSNYMPDRIRNRFKRKS